MNPIMVKTFSNNGYRVAKNPPSTPSINRFSDQIEWALFPCTDFFLGLREIASKTTRLFNLNYLIISNQEFWTLVRTLKQTEQILFAEWRIIADTDWIFESMEGCKILKFWIRNKRIYVEHDDYINSTLNILKAVIHWDLLMDHLQVFDFQIYENELVEGMKNKAKELLGERYGAHKSKLNFYYDEEYYQY